MFSFIIGLAAGVAMPVQTSINAKLRESLQSQYLATAICFAGGTICSAIALLLMTGSLYIPLSKIALEPLWVWSGGLCGSTLVVLSMISLPKLGSVETMVMLVLGQIGIGLAIDNFGWFGVDIIKLSLVRLLGAALVLGGTVMVSMANSGDGEAKDVHASIWLYRAAALIAGVLAGVQVAVNGRLGVVAGQSFRATLISMLTGFLSAMVFALVIYFLNGRKFATSDEPKIEGKWWMWSGGCFGIVIVGSNVIIARTLGTGLSVILNVVGQTFGGIWVDAVGFLGIEKKPVNMVKIIGSIIMIAGIVIVTLF